MTIAEMVAALLGWESIPPEQEAQIDAWIAYCTAYLKALCPALPDTEPVQLVIASMVARAAAIGGGGISSESIGSYSVSYTDAGRAALALTDADKAILASQGCAAAFAGAYTVEVGWPSSGRGQPTSSPVNVNDPYADELVPIPAVYRG